MGAIRFESCWLKCPLYFKHLNFKQSIFWPISDNIIFFSSSILQNWWCICVLTQKNSDWPSWKVFLFVTTNRRIFLMILQLAIELVFAGSNSNCIFSPLPFLLRFLSKTRFYNWFVMKYDSHVMIIQACKSSYALL